mmetsp:Transcript_15632/g.31415  ORF Transcript_15632/g.31415 Transcript_15632/m.31415 type:complete len:150 (-) Transcript_15632:304-753(-)
MASQSWPSVADKSRKVLSLDQLAAKRVDAMLGAMREEARLRHRAPSASPCMPISSSSRNSSCTSLYNLDSAPLASFSSTSNTSTPVAETAVPPHDPRPFSLSDEHNEPSPSPLPVMPEETEAQASIRDLEGTCVSGLVALSGRKRAHGC